MLSAIRGAECKRPDEFLQPWDGACGPSCGLGARSVAGGVDSGHSHGRGGRLCAHAPRSRGWRGETWCARSWACWEDLRDRCFVRGEARACDAASARLSTEVRWSRVLARRLDGGARGVADHDDGCCHRVRLCRGGRRGRTSAGGDSTSWGGLGGRRHVSRARVDAELALTGLAREGDLLAARRPPVGLPAGVAMVVRLRPLLRRWRLGSGLW